MEYPDLLYPNDTLPYPPHSDVLKYLHSYADLFQLRKYVKLSHLVVRVHPIENGKWEVIVRDLPNDTYNTQIFDAIFVCNGHYSEPFIPEIGGVDEFNGKLMHSHDFRSAKAFRGNLKVSKTLNSLDPFPIFLVISYRRRCAHHWSWN